MRLTLVHQNQVQRSLARTEADDLQDLQISYQDISPLDQVHLERSRITVEALTFGEFFKCCPHRGADVGHHGCKTTEYRLSSPPSI